MISFAEEPDYSILPPSSKTAAKFFSNVDTGGTCFGDSGGPIFVSGTSGAYRLDQAGDLEFLAGFGVVP